jgi:recombination protein RecA
MKNTKNTKQNENEEQAIESVFEMIEKKYGKGSVMRLGDDIDRNMPKVSTGSLAIDAAIGIGGLPLGRVVEIYGPESSGKTTLTLQTIAEAQKDNLVCAFIDAEHALDPSYAKKLGVDLNKLIVSQPSSCEEALDIAEKLTMSGVVKVIVIDSVAALVPRAEVEGDMGDSHMGLQARLMSQGLRKLTGPIKDNGVLCIFINQIRMKIGVMFGSPETTSGGNSLKFYASVRIDIRKKTAIKDGDETIGNETKVKIIKNKVAPPFREAETAIMYNKGFDVYREVLEFATKYKVIEKAGSWYSYNGEKIGQGSAKTISHFKDNDHIYQEIKLKVEEILYRKED